jgi:hypothetical protein
MLDHYRNFLEAHVGDVDERENLSLRSRPFDTGFTVTA